MSSTECVPAVPRQRVIIFGSYAPSLINFRGPLIQTLVARGHRAFALAPDIDEEIGQRLRSLGAEPVNVDLERGRLSPRRARATSRGLRRLFLELQPDVVIAYTITPIVLGAAAAHAAGARFIPLITGMGYPFLGGLHPRRLLIRMAAMLMYRRALAYADLVLFQNQDDRHDFAAHRLLRRGLRTALVAGSGVDLQRFRQQPMPERPSFLMIARFLKDKGIREYAQAVRSLKQDYPQTKFQLAGWLDASPDSISRSEIAAMVAGGVECLGRLDDVRPALADCSVFVLPSYREGTPRSVLEAMAVGRAVVTTNAPGCRETVVEGENGFLVPPRDPVALATAMRRFIEDPGLAGRMGEASRRIVEEKFDVEAVNATILAHACL